MTVIGAIICVALIAFALGAINGWVAGYYAAVTGWLARLAGAGDTPPPPKKD